MQFCCQQCCSKHKEDCVSLDLPCIYADADCDSYTKAVLVSVRVEKRSRILPLCDFHERAFQSPFLSSHRVAGCEADFKCPARAICLSEPSAYCMSRQIGCSFHMRKGALCYGCKRKWPADEFLQSHPMIGHSAQFDPRLETKRIKQRQHPLGDCQSCERILDRQIQNILLRNESAQNEPLVQSNCPCPERERIQLPDYYDFKKHKFLSYPLSHATRDAIHPVWFVKGRIPPLPSPGASFAQTLHTKIRLWMEQKEPKFVDTPTRCSICDQDGLVTNNVRNSLFQQTKFGYSSLCYQIDGFGAMLTRTLPDLLLPVLWQLIAEYAHEPNPLFAITLDYIMDGGNRTFILHDRYFPNRVRFQGGVDLRLFCLNCLAKDHVFRPHLAAFRDMFLESQEDMYKK